MKFARRARTDVEVNLTPLIDVVFLLLIFFMVSTTFTKESQLTIDLPEATAYPSRVAEKQIEVSIDREGNYGINGVALQANELEMLKQAVLRISNGDTTIPMIITADAQTPHQAVVTAMDAAGQLGFVKLSITTQNLQAGDG